MRKGKYGPYTANHKIIPAQSSTGIVTKGKRHYGQDYNERAGWDVQKYREEVQKLQNTIKHRINALKRAGFDESNSPALKGLKESGGHISTRGKDLNQLRGEYKRAVTFLNAGTSTTTSATKYREEVASKVGLKPGDKRIAEAYKLIDQLKENSLWHVLGSGAAFDAVTDVIKEDLPDFGELRKELDTNQEKAKAEAQLLAEIMSINGSGFVDENNQEQLRNLLEEWDKLDDFSKRKMLAERKLRNTYLRRQAKTKSGESVRIQ